MPINVFGKLSHDDNNKNDTPLFVQNFYLRTKFIESKTEEDVDLEIQYRNKNLPYLVESKDAVCKSYNDNGLNDQSILKILHI